MKFAFVSDTHFGCANDTGGYQMQPRCNTHAGEILDAFADAIRAEGISFVIHGGDLSDAGTPANIRLAADLLGRLPCPVYLSPGNHDLTRPESIGDWLELAPHLFPGGGPDCTLVADGLRIDMLCCNWGPRPAYWDMQVMEPWFTEGQFALLDAGDLSLPRVVVTHCQACGLPPEQTGEPEEMHAPTEAFSKTVAEICARYHPRAWLGGHNHMTLHRESRGAHLVTAPAFTEVPFEYKVLEFADGALTMETRNLVDAVSFKSPYVFDRTFVQGRLCDRCF